VHFSSQLETFFQSLNVFQERNKLTSNYVSAWKKQSKNGIKLIGLSWLLQAALKIRTEL
jgi:ABC-type long-subunit fatty acid transport system fused permease/ATPase subunit